MAVSIGSSWAGVTSGGSSVSVTTTTPTLFGDLLVCVLTKDDVTATTQPSGWNPVLGFGPSAIRTEVWVYPVDAYSGFSSNSSQQLPAIVDDDSNGYITSLKWSESGFTAIRMAKYYNGRSYRTKFFEYSTTVAFDVSTATYTGNSDTLLEGVSTSGQGLDFCFTDDGLNIVFMTQKSVSYTSARFRYYSLSSAYSLSGGMTSTTNYKTISGSSVEMLFAFDVSPDGGHLYVTFCEGGEFSSDPTGVKDVVVSTSHDLTTIVGSGPWNEVRVLINGTTYSPAYGVTVADEGSAIYINHKGTLEIVRLTTPYVFAGEIAESEWAVSAGNSKIISTDGSFVQVPQIDNLYNFNVSKSAGTYTWTGDSEEYVAAIFEVSGAESDTYVNSTQSGVSATPQSPALTLTGTNLVVSGFGADRDRIPYSIDANLTEIENIHSGGGAGSAGEAFGYELLTGNSAAYNHTISASDEWNGFSIAFKETIVLQFFNHVSSGGAVLSGTSIVAKTISVLPSGQITLSGDALENLVRNILPAGGVLFSGAADTALVTGGTNVYEVFPSGGVATSGSSISQFIWGLSGIGGVTISGGSDIVTIKNITPMGGAVLSGDTLTKYYPSPPYADLITTTTKGDLSLAFDGSFTYDYTGTPGAYTPPPEHPNAIDEDSFTYRVVDEIGTSYPTTVTIYINSVIKTFSMTGSGGITFGGKAIVPYTWEYFSTGGITVAGEALIPFYWKFFPSGGFSFSGSAESDLVGFRTYYDVVLTGINDGVSDHHFSLKSYTGEYNSGMTSNLNFNIPRQSGDIQAIIDRPNAEVVLYKNRKELSRGVITNFNNYSGINKFFSIQASYTSTETSPKIVTGLVKDLIYDELEKRIIVVPHYIDIQPLDFFNYNNEDIEIEKVMVSIIDSKIRYRLKEL